MCSHLFYNTNSKLGFRSSDYIRRETSNSFFKTLATFTACFSSKESTADAIRSVEKQEEISLA